MVSDNLRLPGISLSLSFSAHFRLIAWLAGEYVIASTTCRFDIRWSETVGDDRSTHSLTQISIEEWGYVDPLTKF